LAKYNFPGLKKNGARALEMLLASFSWGASLLKIPILGSLVHSFLELFVNFLANKGLVFLNITDIVIEGKWDQERFDDAMEKALASVELSHEKLTDEQRKRIDDTVIAAFRKFAPITYADPSNLVDGVRINESVRLQDLRDAD
jgi:hypothetical protein